MISDAELGPKVSVFSRAMEGHQMDIGQKSRSFYKSQGGQQIHRC